MHQRSRTHTILAFIVLALLGCSDDGYLRGDVSTSDDGNTYLSIIDDNGGGCGPIYVDGKVWPHPIGVAAPIQPGKHTISCGGEVTIEIPAGVVFAFDYWGP